MSLLRFGFHAPASPLDEIRNRANDVNTHALMHWKSLRMEFVVGRGTYFVKGTLSEVRGAFPQAPFLVLIDFTNGTTGDGYSAAIFSS